ncbi:MAG: PEP-CTERM sorting domain-containing protein [Pirellulaceae bacterium]|nr:PEP-CTERM sorting domain-containing protein [Pirellulaceae bacterium]
MKLVLSLAIALIAFAQVSYADIMFELTPANQQIQQGNTAQFTLRLYSTIPGGEVVDSADGNVNAGPGNGTAGRFVAPTGTVILGNQPVDFQSTLGQAFASNFQAGGILIPYRDVLVNPTTAVDFVSLFLNTTGVALNTYSMTLDSLAANSPTTGALLTGGNSISYIVINSVPEPTSMIMVGAIGIASVLRRRRNAAILG